MLLMILICVVCYLAFVIVVAALQRRLIYYPARAPEPVLLARAEALELVPWRNARGVIIGWRAAQPASSAEARILVLHGNAGFALHRSYLVQALAQVEAGRRWEVFLLEYPGYGARTGQPSETAFREAAGDALAQLQAEDDRPVYVLGESIGSGVASDLAAGPAPVAGLLLITPFNRLTDVAARHFPWLPVRWMLRDRYDNVAALANYPGPVAMLLAGRDEVIAPELGRKLQQTLPGPTLVREQPEATHNTLDLSPENPWWREATAFLLDEDRSR